MKHIKLILALALAVLMFSGFWSSNDNDNERRAERIAESKESLELLYTYKSGTQKDIKSAYGYATFKSIGMTMFIMTAEGGYGVAHNNQTGEDTYMDMVAGGMGMGMGVKDFRAIFIFDNKKDFDDFVDNGYEANAQADATIKAEEDGDSINEAITLKEGMKLYKLTQNGMAMQITIQGSKYWKDKTLN
ncbi:MAG: hypothetical protein Q9M43_04980 [Sulfurimonas sp.]|nr:hypothetical protein [Sulfurimonas sp.]